MPGLLRLDAFNQLEHSKTKRINGMGTDGITGPRRACLLGMSTGSLSQHLQRATTLKLPRAAQVPHAVDDRCYRFFFFPKMSFQLSL